MQIKTSKGLLPFNPEYIAKSVSVATQGLQNVDKESLLSQIIDSVHDGATSRHIQESCIKISSSLIKTHPDYSFVSARFMLQRLYKSIFGHSVYENPNFYTEEYTSMYDSYLDYGIEIKMIDPRLKELFDLEKIKKAIVGSRDLLFKEVGLARVLGQYLLKTNVKPQKPFELPQYWLMRVAMGLSLNEKNPTEMAIKFYNKLSNLEILNSTPTLINSGRVRNQLSSCFLATAEDSLEGIYKTITDSAKMSKYAGGLGIDFTNIRSSGTMIKGTNGPSMGLIPFLKIQDSSTAAINQGGVRKGAIMVSIEPWHGDVFDFLATKYVQGDESRKTPNLHSVLWCPDLFFKRIQGDGDWTLFSPSDVPDLHDLYGQEFETAYQNYENDKTIPKKVIKAKELWEEVLNSLLGKGFGHPWITFKDAANVRNPERNTGIVKSTNLCTEIFLPSNKDETGTCNLASVNLSNHILGGKIDWEKLRDTVQTGIRMLDNVIDINFYTTPETKYANQMRRPVGLGVMGVQDILQEMNLAFESDEAKKLTDKMFEFISYSAIEVSTELAQEKGVYETFEDSLWAKGVVTQDTQKMYAKERNLPINVSYTETMNWDILRQKIKGGMRNSQLLAIAPTRSISYIAGSSPSIEPLDSNIFTESGMLGKYTMINPYLVTKLIALGLWSQDMQELIAKENGSIQKILSIPKEVRDLFKTAWEIHPKHIIEHNALRTKWVDMGISFNQWLPANNIRDAERLYFECWKAGLKSTYYLHSKGTETKATTNKNEEALTAKMCSLLNPDACEACQ